MRYMVGKMGRPQFEQCSTSIDAIGMILAPNAWQMPFSVYALDNGVYGAWCKGRMWDQEMHEDWLKMLDKIPADHPPVWVLLPDAVADWPRTMELARLYLPIVRQRGGGIPLQSHCRTDAT